MQVKTRNTTGVLSTAWGYAFVVVALGAAWWTVMRSLLSLPFEMTLGSLVILIGALTWISTPAAANGSRTAA